MLARAFGSCFDESVGCDVLGVLGVYQKIGETLSSRCLRVFVCFFSELQLIFFFFALMRLGEGCRRQ